MMKRCRRLVAGDRQAAGSRDERVVADRQAHRDTASSHYTASAAAAAAATAAAAAGSGCDGNGVVSEVTIVSDDNLLPS